MTLKDRYLLKNINRFNFNIIKNENFIDNFHNHTNIFMGEKNEYSGRLKKRNEYSGPSEEKIEYSGHARKNN